MNKSMEKFINEGVKELEDSIGRFFAEPGKHGDFVLSIKRIVLQLGMDVIRETFEDMDEILRDSAKRRMHWTIVKRDHTILLTTLGNIEYDKTLYINKDTGERTYLLDRIMQLEEYARMTDDVEAAILEEAVDTSYRKAGDNACVTEEYVSKKTVMNKVHELEFPFFKGDEIKEKKQVRYLYIDADEGHIPLQYIEKKGDITKGIANIAEPKLVYVYEGIDKESEESILINPRYFGGIYEGTWEIENLWNEVYTYIDSVYDLETIEQIYVNSDAAQWIKSGINYIPKTIHVLDGYHLKKYVKQSVIYSGALADDYYTELLFAIKDNDKREARKIFKNLFKLINDDSEKAEEKRYNIEKCKKYILNNFDAAHLRMTGGKGVVGSSTEPHISHIYAQRMAMKPMGWSKIGVDKMSRLLVYKRNLGNMLELVQYQKQENNKVEMPEILSRFDIQLMEKRIRNANKNSDYYRRLQVSTPNVAARKLEWFL